MGIASGQDSASRSIKWRFVAVFVDIRGLSAMPEHARGECPLLTQSGHSRARVDRRTSATPIKAFLMISGDYDLRATVCRSRSHSSSFASPSTRFCLQSSVTQEASERGQMEHIEERSGELVVACGDGTVDFQMANQPLDTVALAIVSCPRIFWTPICPTGGIHDEVEHDPNRNHRCE